MPNLLCVRLFPLALATLTTGDTGDHRGTLHSRSAREGFRDFTWAFHDSVELGPVILKKIAKLTGLTPEDL